MFDGVNHAKSVTVNPAEAVPGNDCGQEERQEKVSSPKQDHNLGLGQGHAMRG